MLVGYYFSSEGISLQLDMEEELPGIPVQAQKMQKVFFDILCTGARPRYANGDGFSISVGHELPIEAHHAPDTKHHQQNHQ